MKPNPPQSKKHQEDQTPPRIVHREYNYTISDDDDKPIAHVNVYYRMSGLWVTNLWVKGTERGNGLATKIMADMIEDLGDRDLTLNVSPYAGDTLDHEALIRFYQSFGFVMSAVNGVMFRRGRKHG